VKLKAINHQTQMADKANDTDRDDDITTTIFQAFKKAEPIGVLASISLAIAALVGSQDKYLPIHDFSIISSFMFIFSFGFFVLYELYKKYSYPARELEPDGYSRCVFYYNMIRIAPIYFAAIGIILLVFIAYQFGIDSTTLPVTSKPAKNPLPIFHWVGLFFISYFLFYSTYPVIKNFIASRKRTSISRGGLLHSLISVTFFLLVELYIVGEITHFFNSKDLPVYASIILISTGIVSFTKDIFSLRWKRRYTLIALLIMIVSVPFVIEFILKVIGILDKRFNTFEYAINASRNNLSHLNWHAVEVTKLLYDIANLSNSSQLLVILWT
jgi:hypothetical protein